FGTPNIQSNILSQLTANHPPGTTQNIIAQYGPSSGFSTSVSTIEVATSSNLSERTRNLKDWLRQARVETSDIDETALSLSSPIALPLKRIGDSTPIRRYEEWDEKVTPSVKSCEQIENDNNNSRRKSWSRAVFSSLQRKGLEKRFIIQKYITKPDRRQLAGTLGLTDAQDNIVYLSNLTKKICKIKLYDLECKNVFEIVQRIRLQRPKNQFFKWELPFFIADLKRAENFTSTYKVKPSTLWSMWSMLKKMLNTKENIDIGKFLNLKSMIKNNSKGLSNQTNYRAFAFYFQVTPKKMFRPFGFPEFYEVSFSSMDHYSYVRNFKLSPSTVIEK
ncbi:unnamed protein product, partial [Trichogramma brassicae]